MKTVGIVSEYNPFHNGHQYHIQTAKAVCEADAAVCIMSGSFVQRGEPAVFDKWTRARMAIQGGADLVIELPFVFACQPAEIFAYGAVKILDRMNLVDSLCFGSELGDTGILEKLAAVLANEPSSFRHMLRQQLSKGSSYPKAVSDALSGYIKESSELPFAEILSFPNNVLGIEYIKAILQLNSPIKPVAVKRIVSRYNDMEITHAIASATAIRNEIRQNGMNEKAVSAIPLEAVETAQAAIAAGKHPVFFDAYSDLLLYRLRTMTPHELQGYLNIKEGIEYRLLKAAAKSGSIEALIGNIKTKRYTRTYIQRLFCHILLDLKRQDIQSFKASDCPAYIRVLGFNEKGSQLLKRLKHCSRYPVITKTADFKAPVLLLERMLHFDTLSTDIRSLGYREAPLKKAGEDFLTSPYYHQEKGNIYNMDTPVSN